MRLLTSLICGPPESAAASLVSLATSSQYEPVPGKFFKGEQVIQSSAYSMDPPNQERLWDLSGRHVGIAP